VFKAYSLMQRLHNPSFDRALVLPKSFYFFYFAAAASLMPFLALYYEQVGLSGRQIGLLAGMLPLISLVSASFWGGLADATQRHRRLLRLAMGGTLIAVLALSLTSAFYLLIVVVVVYAVVSAPILPLVDSTVVAMLGKRRREYGKQRLWGAVGWGLSAPVAGVLIDRTGLDWAFYGYLVLMCGGFVVSTRLPVSRASIGTRFWRGLRSLVTNRQWIIFLVTILIGFVGLSIAISFLFLYMNSLGASKTLMGVSLTVATVSELPVWFFSSRLLERWGTRGVLTLSLLACAIQGFAYSLIRNPWLVLPIQLLHGPAFSAMWAAGVSYASEMAPEGMGATAQGLFQGVAMGLRSALGAFLGGVLYDGVGAVMMFRWGGVSALVGLTFFVLAGKRRHQGGQTGPG
jgi:PPP family 3-phenylpropionic acid transporter